MKILFKVFYTLLISTILGSALYGQASTRVKGDLEIPGTIRHTDASYSPITSEGSSYIELTSANMKSGGNFLLIVSNNPVVITGVTVRYNYIPPVYITTGSTDSVLIKGNVGVNEEWYAYIKDNLFSSSSSRTLYNIINVTEINSTTEYRYWLEIPAGKFTTGKGTWTLHFDYKYIYR